MSEKELEELDERDIYDSLKYAYIKHGKKSTDDYLDVWFINTKDEDLERDVNVLKKGGWFGNADYQAVQPGLRLLCEKQQPYRGDNKICKMDNIMDKDAYAFGPTWQGQMIIFLPAFIFAFLYGLQLFRTRKNARQRKRR